MEWYHKYKANPKIRQFEADSQNTTMAEHQWAKQSAYKYDKGLVLHPYQHCEIEAFPTIGWQGIEFEGDIPQWEEEYGKEFVATYQNGMYIRYMIGVRNTYLVDGERYYDITLRESIMYKRIDNGELEELYIDDFSCAWFDGVSQHRLVSKGINLGDCILQVIVNRIEDF
jgi:hypothetical protein